MKNTSKTNIMRPFRLLLLLFILFPATFYAQKSLTGLWTGSLHNDSAQIRKDKSFELALTQYRDKVYGYSRSTFLLNDTLYYILKRVKGKINGDVCEITDDEIISNNFQNINKGVKVTITFRMNNQDSTWHLDGRWSTSKSKKYGFYSISGDVELKDEPDLSKSEIFPHLEELKLAKDVPFYAEKKKATETKAIAAATPAKKEKPVKNDTKPVAKKDNTTIKPTDPAIAKNDTKKPGDSPANKPVAKEEKKSTEQPVLKNEPKKQDEVAITKPAEEKKAPVTNQVTTEIKKQDQPVAVAEPKEKKDPPPAVTKPVVNVPVAAALVKERKMESPQEVSFISDSLQLALYDNGEVDGDTVSVLLNGNIILARQGLKTTAIRKTIYMPAGTDEVTLVLYAENLGKYPPNTGLLVVYDGEERYQVRFSADLQQNATVIFRRKKK